MSSQQHIKTDLTSVKKFIDTGTDINKIFGNILKLNKRLLLNIASQTVN